MGGACLAAAVPPVYALENTQCPQLYGLDGTETHPRYDRAQRETNRDHGPPRLPNKRVGDLSGFGGEPALIIAAFIGIQYGFLFGKHIEPRYCKALGEFAATIMSALDRIAI